MATSPDGSELSQIYSARFGGVTDYRNEVWRVLLPFFAKWLPPAGSILDLGAGYCEFINNVTARRRYAMDLNPDVYRRAAEDVTVLHQDCSKTWDLAENTLDTVFTSNFLEHLPDKAAVRAVLANSLRCLKPGGRLIAIGPNIKYVPGAYWDFFDHFVALTELSLEEVLTGCGFEIEESVARFLPYTMWRRTQYPTWMVRLYLNLPAVWPFFGKQFLVVARKPVARN